MQKAVVYVTENGRRTYRCPRCGGRGTRLTQGEVFMRGEFPAPQVEVRECRSCGTLFEHDRWIADRAVWRGAA